MFAHDCESKDSLEETFEDETAELMSISKMMARFPKKNKNRPRVAIITNSAAPVIVAYFDKDADEMKNLIVEVPEIPLEDLKDSNAAGDSFVGGFLAQLSKLLAENGGVPDTYPEEYLRKAVEAGNEVAGKVVQVFGAQYPNIEE